MTPRKTTFLLCRLGLAAALTASGFVLAWAPTAHRETPPTPRRAVERLKGETTARAPAATVTEILARISAGAGVQVVADSSVAGAHVRLPAPVSGGTARQQLARLVRALPPGTSLHKVYLPSPAAGRPSYNGDDVAAYVAARKRLFPGAHERDSEGVEILGRRFSGARADAYVAELNLKPVYLVTNLAAYPAPKAGDGVGMTPERRLAMLRKKAMTLPSREFHLEDAAAD